jgi:hypothetical protein
MTAVNMNVLLHVMITEKNEKFGIWEIILLLKCLLYYIAVNLKNEQTGSLQMLSK